MFPCGAFFLDFLIKCLSTCPNFTKPPLPRKISGFAPDAYTNMWRRGVVVASTAQFHSTKLELRFYAGSNLARGVSEIRDGEDL